MYRVNEIFFTLQGEGAHSGIPAVFVRFSGCNLRCPWCDMEFEEYTEMTADEIIRTVQELYEVPNERRKMCVLTGGEPSLQVDKPLIDALHQAGFYICIETNGTHTKRPAGRPQAPQSRRKADAAQTDGYSHKSPYRATETPQTKSHTSGTMPPVWLFS